MIIFDNKPCDNKEDDYEYDLDSLLIRLIRNDSSLTGLDVRGKLTPEEFVTLFKALRNNHKVDSLILRGTTYSCDLSNELVYSGLAALMNKNNAIKSLSLYHTGIREDGIDFINRALVKNNALKYFKIRGNDISMNGKLSLVKMLNQKDILGDFNFNLPFVGAAEPFYYILNTNILFQTGESHQKNIINYDINQKELQIEKLISSLKWAEFPQYFIDSINNFFQQNWNEEAKAIATKYDLWKNERFEKLAAATESKIDEVDKHYENLKFELFREYNNIQKIMYDSLIKMWQGLLVQYKELDQSEMMIMEELIEYHSDVDIAPEVPQAEVREVLFVPVINTEEIESPKIKEDQAEVMPELVQCSAKPEKKTTVFTPVVKKIDIEEGLKPKEYFSKWVNNVSQEDYEFAIISVGGGGHISQQIPHFSEELGRAAILNLDPCFTSEEMTNTSASSSVSVNYLKGGLQRADHFILLSPEKKQAFKAESDDISQEEFADKIKSLITSGKKVILLSHISITAPIIFFELVLKNQDIMNSYGDKFLFMHSYFKEQPTILCSKNFVSKMMPAEQDYGVKESFLISSIGNKIYGQLAPNIEKVLTLEEGIVCKDLSSVEPENILDLLGGSTDSLDSLSARKQNL